MERAHSLTLAETLSIEQWQRLTDAYRGIQLLRDAGARFPGDKSLVGNAWEVLPDIEAGYAAITPHSI